MKTKKAALFTIISVFEYKLLFFDEWVSLVLKLNTQWPWAKLNCKLFGIYVTILALSCTTESIRVIISWSGCWRMLSHWQMKAGPSISLRKTELPRQTGAISYWSYWNIHLLFMSLIRLQLTLNSVQLYAVGRDDIE